MRLIIVMVLLLVGSAALAAEMRTTLSLSGLTCAACSAAVTKALKEVNGVREVTVSPDQRQAVVVADEPVAPDALIAAVARAGFSATVGGQ